MEKSMQCCLRPLKNRAMPKNKIAELIGLTKQQKLLQSLLTP